MRMAGPASARPSCSNHSDKPAELGDVDADELAGVLAEEVGDEGLRGDRVGSDHGADDVAAAEAAQQREADRDAILIEHDAAGGLEQGRHQTRAVQPGGGVIERGQRRRVAATDRPQAVARRQRHQARPERGSLKLPDGAAGDEAERLVKRQPGRGRVQHDGPVAQAVEGGGGEAAAQAAALRRGGNGDQADSAERPSDGGADEPAVEIGGDAAAEARHERPIGQPMRPAEDGGQRMGSWQVGVGEGAEVGHIIPGTARSVPSIRRE